MLRNLGNKVVASIIGLICLLFVLIGTPLLLIASRLLLKHDSALASGFEQRLNDSAVPGRALFAKAAIDLVLALTLSAENFLATSKVINWAIIGAIIVFTWWVCHRAGSINRRVS